MGFRNFFVIGKKIIGVKSNYTCHLEGKKLKLSEFPSIFLKPTTSYILEPDSIQIPNNLDVRFEGLDNFLIS